MFAAGLRRRAAAYTSTWAEVRSFVYYSSNCKSNSCSKVFLLYLFFSSCICSCCISVVVAFLCDSLYSRAHFSPSLSSSLSLFQVLVERFVYAFALDVLWIGGVYAGVYCSLLDPDAVISQYLNTVLCRLLAP